MDHRDTTAWINLAAIRSNFRELERLAQGSLVCPVIKADAYGHGAVAIAHALEHEGAQYCAVALAKEALELRESGIQMPILIFGAPENSWSSIAVRLGCAQTIYSEEHVRILASAARSVGLRARAHIKVDGLRFAPNLSLPPGFEPALSLTTRIRHIRDVPSSETVSYGRTFTAPRRSRIALLPIGYADGYSRGLSSGNAFGTPSGVAIGNKSASIDQRGKST